MEDEKGKKIVLAFATIVVSFLVWVRFSGDFVLPVTPTRPTLAVTNAKENSQSVERSDDVYQQHLRDDSHRFRVPTPSVSDMTAVFPYREDSRIWHLRAGRTTTVLGLKLQLKLVKTKRSKRSKKKGQDMVLRIKNTTNKRLAYRILTEPSYGTGTCKRKKHLPHNAIVLLPGGVETRAECAFQKKGKLRIHRVETVEVPALSQFYLSSLPPTALGLDVRTSKSHRPPANPLPCRRFESGTLAAQFKKGALRWRDRVDFFARYRCTYSYPDGYSAIE